MKARSIYFVAPADRRMIKIGVSNDVARTVERLSWCSPDPLELLASAPGTMRDEKFIHHQLVAHWSHFEWFYPATAVRALLDFVQEHHVLPQHMRAPAGWTIQYLPRIPKTLEQRRAQTAAAFVASQVAAAGERRAA